MIVTFGVKNCKIRGILIESVVYGKGDTYYFKYQNQPMVNHCIQVQNTIRAANVKRSKKIAVDISEFIHHYRDVARNKPWFDGIKLESSGMQIEKVLTKRMNIDIGVKKRMFTIQDNKGAKAAAKKELLDHRNAIAEQEFQKERAKRITRLVELRRAQRSGGSVNDATVST